mmetsp:Transcript_49433/g.143336  ORF Transcript_49433/g.143336 Transcript_49433/m.143336 type:complete len:239 (-) Transcript_49433:1417-2133(-)
MSAQEMDCSSRAPLCSSDGGAVEGTSGSEVGSTVTASSSAQAACRGSSGESSEEVSASEGSSSSTQAACPASSGGSSGEVSPSEGSSESSPLLSDSSAVFTDSSTVCSDSSMHSFEVLASGSSAFSGGFLGSRHLLGRAAAAPVGAAARRAAAAAPALPLEDPEADLPSLTPTDSSARSSQSSTGSLHSLGVCVLGTGERSTGAGAGEEASPFSSKTSTLTGRKSPFSAAPSVLFCTT